MKYYFEHIKDGQVSEGYTAINIVNYEAEIANDDADAVLVARKNDGVPKETPEWEERFHPPLRPGWEFFWLTNLDELKSLAKSDVGEASAEIGIPLDIDTLADVIRDHLPRGPRGYLSVERVGRTGPFRLSCGRWGFLGELQLSKRGDATILSLTYVPLPTPDELFRFKMLDERELFRYGKQKHRGEVIRKLFESLRHDPIWQGKPFDQSLKRCLEDFAGHIRSEKRMTFWKRDNSSNRKWIPQPEAHAKNLLQTFLSGRFGDSIYTFEEITSGAGRIDIFIVSPSDERVVIELKMCGHGYSMTYAQEGKEQLLHYCQKIVFPPIRVKYCWKSFSFLMG